MATPAIEFSGVNKIYQRRLGGVQVAALSNISFEVARGEVCAFLGPNGAGKTTSMNILMGFIYASSGRSRVFGYEPGDVRAKERIGFLAGELRVLSLSGCRKTAAISSSARADANRPTRRP